MKCNCTFFCFIFICTTLVEIANKCTRCKYSLFIRATISYQCLYSTRYKVFLSGCEDLEETNVCSGEAIYIHQSFPHGDFLLSVRFKFSSSGYANGVHLIEIWENTALVQWIRCEPLGEHIIHWTCAVFSHIAREMNNVCIFSHDQVKHYIMLPYIVLNLHLECNMGWYRYKSHSENHSTECDNLFFKSHMGEYKKIPVNVLNRTYNITHINVYIIIQSITVFLLHTF